MMLIGHSEKDTITHHLDNINGHKLLRSNWAINVYAHVMIPSNFIHPRVDGNVTDLGSEVITQVTVLTAKFTSN
jgi:hypothetical protein